MLQYIADDVRRHLATLGFRSIDELVGRTDLLMVNPQAALLVNQRNLDLGFVLANSLPSYQSESNPFNEGISELNSRIVADTAKALADNTDIDLHYTIQATDRAALATLAGEIARKENYYRLHVQKQPELYPYTREMKITFQGSAGQGFGVFMTDGMNIKLYGEANDSVAKSMSGGKMVIRPSLSARFQPEENVIIGNCALYGATGGLLYVNGIAGDRFAVRNSGAYAVVEGVGLHACEYMTRGRVVILGSFSENLGSGMTGGEIYLFNPHSLDFVNTEYLTVAEIKTDDREELYNMLQDYLIDTGSARVHGIINDWERQSSLFVKLIPVNTLKKKKKEQLAVV
jgi:glutamate synthase domain-containing protein 3